MSNFASACSEDTTLFLRELQPTNTSNDPKGVILYVHGLNNNDTIFNPLAKELSENGYHSIFATLAGHDGRPENKHCASAKLWQDNIVSAVNYIRLTYPHTPLYAAGFSLGGAVITASLSNLPNDTFKKILFLSPALSVRTYTQLVRLFFPLGWFNISLPSFVPEQYVAYSSTSINSYRSLFRVMERAQEVLSAKSNLPQTLILIDDNDELVSKSGLQSLIDDNNLTNWKIDSSLKRKEDSDLHYHHNFAKEFYSQNDWNKLKLKIFEFLQD